MAKQWTIRSDDLLWPTLKALEAKGGSASIQELSEQITSDLGLSDQILEVPHKEGGTQSEFEFRSAWARTALKKLGAVENTSKGVWTITKQGRQIQGENEVRNLNRTSDRKGINVFGMDAIKRGEMTATLAIPFDEEGRMAVRNGIKLAKGEKLPKSHLIQAFVMTKSNAP